MEGTLKTYLPSKRMGFIAGDDGTDYFVHADDAIESIQWIEGQRLSFDEGVTPKGYRARQVRASDATFETHYRVPDDMLLEKREVVPDWDVIASTRYTIFVKSKQSRDDAEALLVQHARSLGANALVNVRYSRTTEISGNHNYSVHHFVGDPVVVARRSNHGQLRLDDIPDLERAASARYRKVKANNDLYWDRAKPVASLATIAWIAGSMVAISEWGFRSSVLYLLGSAVLLALGIASIPPARMHEWLRPQSAAPGARAVRRGQV